MNVERARPSLELGVVVASVSPARRSNHGLVWTLDQRAEFAASGGRAGQGMDGGLLLVVPGDLNEASRLLARVEEMTKKDRRVLRTHVFGRPQQYGTPPADHAAYPVVAWVVGEKSNELVRWQEAYEKCSNAVHGCAFIDWVSEETGDLQLEALISFRGKDAGLTIHSLLELKHVLAEVGIKVVASSVGEVTPNALPNAPIDVGDIDLEVELLRRWSEDVTHLFVLGLIHRLEQRRERTNFARLLDVSGLEKSRLSYYLNTLCGRGYLGIRPTLKRSYTATDVGLVELAHERYPYPLA